MLPRKFRLRKSVDVQRVVKFGKRQNTSHLRLYWQQRTTNNDPTLKSRSTVVVGKKVAKGAVTRNRIKRRTRAALKSIQIPHNIDLVIFPTDKVLTLPFKVLCEELEATIGKIR